jgi:hypothetical protein
MESDMLRSIIQRQVSHFVKRHIKSLQAILISLVLTLIAGTGACSSDSPRQLTAYEGTKKGCVLKYKSRGYQQWKAVELCKRF